MRQSGDQRIKLHRLVLCLYHGELQDQTQVVSRGSNHLYSLSRLSRLIYFVHVRACMHWCAPEHFYGGLKTTSRSHQWVPGIQLGLGGSLCHPASLSSFLPGFYNLTIVSLLELGLSQHPHSPPKLSAVQMLFRDRAAATSLPSGPYHQHLTNPTSHIKVVNGDPQSQ